MRLRTRLIIGWVLIGAIVGLTIYWYQLGQVGEWAVIASLILLAILTAVSIIQYRLSRKK